jgi:hypothetical protein
MLVMNAGMNLHNLLALIIVQRVQVLPYPASIVHGVMNLPIP